MDTEEGVVLIAQVAQDPKTTRRNNKHSLNTGTVAALQEQLDQLVNVGDGDVPMFPSGESLRPSGMWRTSERNRKREEGNSERHDTECCLAQNMSLCMPGQRIKKNATHDNSPVTAGAEGSNIQMNREFRMLV